MAAQSVGHNISLLYVDKGCNPIRCTAKGTFHQSSSRFKTFSRGSQCVPNAAVALIRASYSSPRNWTSEDIDEVLTAGDLLYTEIRHQQNIQHNYLLVTELPSTISVQQMAFSFISGQCILRQEVWCARTKQTKLHRGQICRLHFSMYSNSLHLLSCCYSWTQLQYVTSMADFTSSTLIAVTQTVLLVLKLLAIPF